MSSWLSCCPCLVMELLFALWPTSNSSSKVACRPLDGISKLPGSIESTSRVYSARADNHDPGIDTVRGGPGDVDLRPNPQEPQPHQFLSNKRRTLSRSLWLRKRKIRRNRRLSNELLSSLVNKRTIGDQARIFYKSTTSILKTLLNTTINYPVGMAGAYDGNPVTREVLEATMIMDDCNHRFLPESRLNALFDEPAVKATLKQSKLRLRNNVTELVRFVCEDSKKVFAALVWHEVETLIDDFFEMRFGDDELPVHYDMRSGQLSFGLDYKVLKSHPFTGDHWKKRHLDDFCNRNQWPFQSPVFKEHKFRYSLPTQACLPFLEYEPLSEKPSGFSVVKEHHVHRDHLSVGNLMVLPNSDDENPHPRVAIKELKKGLLTDDEFKRIAHSEANTLEMLRDLNHDHLIKAIAYYTQGSKHFVMFPWADHGNLRDFWKQDPPRLDYECLTWAFTQLLGLADAIKALHHPGPERHWRHGDLKPENILCFKSAKPRPGTCTMVIADVGLSKNHIMATENRLGPTGTTSGTLMYEAPEARLRPDEPRSRRYDVWSMGCIFLEFVIWLLDGAKELKSFQTELSSRGNTNFYVIDYSQQTARLNNIVMNRIGDIREDPRCANGTALHSFLDLITDELLVTNIAQLSAPTRRDSVLADSDTDPSSSRNPRVMVRTATLSSEEADNSTLGVRAKAERMHSRMQNIFNDAVNGRLDWMKWDAAASARSQSRLYGKHLAATDAINDAGRSRNPEVR